ncbi:hypothetical protein D9758_010486 [Tetrapyrgos nigripes]|uniref:SMODS and SLOG-associating 2TM effector domain-containing protein n=1 Tax=Tetrapyrgos nigripes TaxID=182062 RepID=A0A8H5CZI1_9AGAR|nr:hypothetical protein D9758_010486 [Tetrapyrgos nigripes]
MDPGEGSQSHRQSSTSQAPGSQHHPPFPDPSNTNPNNPQPILSQSSPSQRTSGIIASTGTGPASFTDERQPLVERDPHPHFAPGSPTAPTEVPTDVRQSVHALSNQPLPPLPHRSTVDSGVIVDSPSRGHFLEKPRSYGHGSNVDWLVPTVPEKSYREKTYGDRLQPTVDTAEKERLKYENKAKMTGYALNAAIGLQVLLGALTTGLSVVTTGRQTSIMTAILGGLATIVASYLARARGSNEPELSITRVKDLEQFIRECRAFQMDFGHLVGSEHNDKLIKLRQRFEELLGNGNGERRLAPPV